jgi:SAM-dependent methyltransferase
MDFEAVNVISKAYAASALDRTVHPNDVMYNTGADHYWTVGNSAIKVILSGMTLSWTHSVHRILDLPCGHGRVARHLRAAFPASDIFFCDIDAEGADFCASQFGGTALHSRPDLLSVPLPRDLDLIWVGSLFTHVDRMRSDAWLRYLVDHLRPHGVIVATFHGLFSPALFGRSGESNGASHGKLIEQFEQSGYGYGRYEGPDDYGLSISHPATVVKMATNIPGTRMVSYVERGWAYNHDVVILAKQDRLETFEAASAVTPPTDEAAMQPLSVAASVDEPSKRVIVHIGVQKTGSTAIQALMHRNVERLSEAGFYYAPTQPLDFPNHNPLAAAFKKDSPPVVGERGMAALLAAAGHRTPIISAEMLCQPDTDIDRFMATLRGRDVEVIAYVRHPCDIVVSAFNESVRHYPTRRTQPVNERPFAYDPAQLVVLRGWVGREDAKVILAPYDRAQWPQRSIFADFLRTLGIDADGFDMTDTRENESLSYAAANQLREFNKSNPTPEEHSAFIKELRSAGGSDTGYPLTRKSVSECLRRMRKALPVLRPHFREGFDESFLLEGRPWVRRDGWGGVQDTVLELGSRLKARANALVR